MDELKKCIAYIFKLSSQALLYVSAMEESSQEPKITINWLDLVDKPKRGRPKK